MKAKATRKDNPRRRSDADEKRKKQALNPETARQMVKPITKGRLAGSAERHAMKRAGRETS
jgi:hypothetical protein